MKAAVVTEMNCGLSSKVTMFKLYLATSISQCDFMLCHPTVENAVRYGVRSAISNATSLFNAWMSASATVSIPTSLMTAVYTAAIIQSSSSASVQAFLYLSQRYSLLRSTLVASNNNSDAIISEQAAILVSSSIFFKSIRQCVDLCCDVQRSLANTNQPSLVSALLELTIEVDTINGGTVLSVAHLVRLIGMHVFARYMTFILCWYCSAC
jgi:hypothetical protein